MVDFDSFVMRCRWALICQLASWFNFYCSVRTVINSAEAFLAAYGAYHWLCSLEMLEASHAIRKKDVLPGKLFRAEQQRWLLAAATSAVVRPSSILFWAPVALYTLLRRAPDLLSDGFLIGCTVLFAATGMDRLWYGRWVFVPWEFFKFNLLQGGSSLYGSHGWHWNFSSGFPVVLATLLPLLLRGAAACSR
jgi:GPI mannosyltransferase 3